MAVKWTVEIIVNDIWIEDGFSLDREEEQIALAESLLPYAIPGEISVKTISHVAMPE